MGLYLENLNFYYIWSTLVCREVFVVTKEILLLPMVYSPISQCLLHVVNNDTGEEIERFLNRVGPHVYQPNKVSDWKIIVYLVYLIYILYVEKTFFLMC